MSQDYIARIAAFRQKGSQETAENIARNLLKNGMSVDFFHQMTQLPTETIEALKH